MSIFHKKSPNTLYVFLDIDGVLNTKSDWERPFQINKTCILNFANFITNARKQFADVKIILTSTWRRGGNDSSGYNIIEKALLSHKITIDGCTPISDKGRQKEIEYYIAHNKVTDYVIIDDDESIFDDVNGINLHLTDFTKGFSESDSKEILKKIKKNI